MIGKTKIALGVFGGLFVILAIVFLLQMLLQQKQGYHEGFAVANAARILHYQMTKKVALQQNELGISAVKAWAAITNSTEFAKFAFPLKRNVSFNIILDDKLWGKPMEQTNTSIVAIAYPVMLHSPEDKQTPIYIGVTFGGDVIWTNSPVQVGNGTTGF
jgi:hypothetical protein